jgi:hypothetical protein
MQSLLTPSYLTALAVLVLNDLWWKYAWPGPITGKLSDFAGLFAFAVFFACVSRRPAAACIGTGVAFVIWKSPLVEPLLVGPVSRVADVTDLLALAILPLAYRHSVVPRPAPLRSHAARAAIAILSVAAFVNTSIPRYEFDVPPTDPAARLVIAMPYDDVRAQLEKCGYDPHQYTVPVEGGTSVEFLSLSYRTRAPGRRRDVRMAATIASEAGVTTLQLDDFEIYRQQEPGNEAAVVADFHERMRKCFATALR